MVTAAIDQLEADGPNLGRPLVDRIEDSKIHNLKELRPGSAGTSEVRILFVFDPERQAVLLVAGDKTGRWNRWYDENIPVAESVTNDGSTASTARRGQRMARNWRDVRAQAVDTGLDETRVHELGAKLRANVRAHRLAEIRQAYGLDQSTLAERIGVSQSRISRIERGELDRAEIATVRSYVEALGGEVEIVARFGDERITVG